MAGPMLTTYTAQPIRESLATRKPKKVKKGKKRGKTK